jgi:hypothetical protein
MASRSIFIYLGSALNFRDLREALEPLGYFLVHPSSGEVIQLTMKGSIVVDLNVLEAAVANHMEVSFQFWLAECRDLYARIRTQGELKIIEFGLEGKSEHEREQLRQALSSFFFGCGSGIGMVYDPEGLTEDFDWDEFFIAGRSILALDFPDVLILAEPFEIRMAPRVPDPGSLNRKVVLSTVSPE